MEKKYSYRALAELPNEENLSVDQLRETIWDGEFYPEANSRTVQSDPSETTLFDEYKKKIGIRGNDNDDAPQTIDTSEKKYDDGGDDDNLSDDSNTSCRTDKAPDIIRSDSIVPDTAHLRHCLKLHNYKGAQGEIILSVKNISEQEGEREYGDFVYGISIIYQTDDPEKDTLVYYLKPTSRTYRYYEKKMFMLWPRWPR